MKKILLIALSIMVTACADQSVDKYKERAGAEQDGSNRADNDNLAKKAAAMEKDLRKRYRFYTGIGHDYSGDFKIGQNNYKAKMTFVPSRHIVETDRTRTLEEIQDDINNLHLNAQVVIWDEAGSIGVSGCVFENIKPDLDRGWIQLLSSDCPNRFSIKLTVPDTQSEERSFVSKTLAQALLVGSQTQIDYLHADVSSKFNPQGYEVTAQRVP